MRGHTAHGNIRTQMLAAFCQRNIQRRRRSDGIVKEHLVKIAHTIKQQGILMLCLDGHVLRHHRCNSGVDNVHQSPNAVMSQIYTAHSPDKSRKAEDLVVVV